MPDRGEYCPFLNRADARCGGHFCLDGLERAFAFCFGRYRACAVYTELRDERRLERAAAATKDQPTTHARAGNVIQVTIPSRRTRADGVARQPDAARVPAVPRF